MPQLDFANNLTISQVVWMAIIFTALYLLLAQWALPQVASVLDERAARIDADLATARTAKGQADQATTEMTDATKRANTAAQSSIATAIAQAKSEATDAARTAAHELDTQLREAEARIGVARNAAMGALRQVASDTAANVVLRLTGHVPDQAAVDAAVSAVMPKVIA